MALGFRKSQSLLIERQLSAATTEQCALGWDAQALTAMDGQSPERSHRFGEAYHIWWHGVAVEADRTDRADRADTAISLT